VGTVPNVGVRQTEANWVSKKNSHKFKSLTDPQLTKVASFTDESLLKTYVNAIMIPRVSGSPGNEKVRHYLIDTMRRLGWKVEANCFEDNTPYGKKHFCNIVATLPICSSTPAKSSATSASVEWPTCSSQTLPVRRLAMACHYDSKYYENNPGFVGATDSAVPCAMMLHLAKTLDGPLMAERLRNNDVTLEFIFFDGEEAFKDWNAKDSIYGSRNLAQLWHGTPHPTDESESTTRLDSIDVFMLLDLIGEANPVFYNFFAATSRHFERLARIEKRLSKAGLLTNHCNGCNKYFPSSTIVNSFIEDDHIPFLRKGVPILHVIPYPFPQGWHNPGDNGDNLDYPTIYNLSKIFAAFVIKYLNLPIS